MPAFGIKWYRTVNFFFNCIFYNKFMYKGWSAMKYALKNVEAKHAIK